MRDKRRLLLVHALIVLFFFGMLSFSQEDLEREEAELFKKYQSLNKDYEKGKMYFTRGDYKKAKKEFENILGKLPEHADAHFFLSQVLYKEGDLAGALNHVEKAKANYEYSVGMKIKMAQVSKQKLEEKRQVLEDNIGRLEDQIANLLPQASEVEDEVKNRKKEIQTKIDKMKKQIENIDTQLSLPLPREEAMPAEYCYFNGNIYFKMKKFQEAHDQYQETIRIDPEHGDAYNNLAALYFQVKQYQKAMDYLNQAEENGAKVNPEFKKTVLKALGKD